MTQEQHNLLVQLAQQGLQRLSEQATAALQACAPVPPENEKEAVQKAPKG
jgi:hypothetical protein